LYIKEELNLQTIEPAAQNLENIPYEIGLEKTLVEISEKINNIVENENEKYQSIKVTKFHQLNIVLNFLEKMTSLRILRKHKYYEYLKHYLSPRERQICMGTLIDFLQNKEDWNWVYQHLSDTDSRNTLYNILKIRLNASILGRESFEIFHIGSKLSESERLIQKYRYKNLVKIEKGDNVIDAGAYVGKDSINFAHMNELKGKVFALEPQKKPFKILVTNIVNKNLNEVITPLKLGVWSETTKKKLQGNGPSASIICSPNHGFNHYENIECITIDEYFKNVPLDFIKMDVEGAELEALKGTRNTIKNYKPKLAICVYHRIRDIVDIPRYLKSIRPDYKIFIQQIHPGIKETILFAL